MSGNIIARSCSLNLSHFARRACYHCMSRHSPEVISAESHQCEMIKTERRPTTGKPHSPSSLADLERAHAEHPPTQLSNAAALAAQSNVNAPPSIATDVRTVSGLRRKSSASDFNMAMVHFYRGEVQRSNTWRNRLDTTTNWAVLTAGATLSFAFSSESNPHFVIIINSILIAYFLIMEARRYRYYEIWSNRVRILETQYLAQMLTPEKVTKDEWAEHLAHDLLTPRFTISEWEAIGRRLRRNYWWIFLLLALSWNLKVYLHPTPALTFHAFLERASVGVVPGSFVFAIGVFFNAVLLIFGIATVRLREATGEVLPHHEFDFHPFQRVSTWTQHRRAGVVRRTERARARIRARKTAQTEIKKSDSDQTTQDEFTAVEQ